MKAFIYTGGSIEEKRIKERPEGEDLIIAADAGYLNAKRLGVAPSIVVGDLDSLGEEEFDGQAELVRLPREKDLTDTQAAVSLALEKGAREIVIIGGLDGRIDHALSNMAILEALFEKKIRAVITDGRNRVRYIKDSGEIIVRDGFKYLSVIAADKVVKGVSIEGCKYPLKNAKLYRGEQFAVSNEILINCALITVRRGGLYIIESSDKVD